MSNTPPTPTLPTTVPRTTSTLPSTVVTQAAQAVQALLTPLRGSVDGDGVIMGGAALTSGYDLEPSPYGYLHFETQRRHRKGMQQLETDFQKKKSSPDSSKFDRKLEVDPKSKDYDLDRFCLEVEEGIEFYGFEPFFYGPSLADPTIMVHIVKERHLVSLTSVLEEHESRLVTPAVVLDPVTGHETPSSRNARHKCYDSFERRDIALTRLYIRSLLSDTFSTRPFKRSTSPWAPTLLECQDKYCS